MTKIEQFLELVKAHPDLPIVPMVDSEVIDDDCYAWWMGQWGNSEVTGIFNGRTRIHFKDDDEEDVLADLPGCQYYCDPNGKDITELSDEEWNALYASISWTHAIVVYITT